MQISEEKVDKYIAIYLQEYGEKIERARARDELTSLICLMESVYQFINQDNEKITCQKLKII